MGNLNSSNMELNVTKSCKQTALLLLTADGSVPLKKGNTLFNAGFVLPHSAEIDLGFLPFDRKFRKFRMEGKWYGHFSEIPTEN